MGQVFTWEDVLRKRIPTLNAFDDVLAGLREVLQEIESISGAIICGSVLRREHTVRSDIDCFVLYDHERELEAMVYMRAALMSAFDMHVPLSFITCDTLIGSTRMHHVGTSFMRHLQRSVEAGGLLKGNPLEHIVPSIPVRDELESYLRMKMYNLQEAWTQADTFSPEREAAYLKKLTEAPVHVARKVLAILEPLEGDSKSYIKARYRELLPKELADQLESLIQMDEDYTHLLSEAYEYSWEQLDYQQYLAGMMSRTTDVLSFIRSNLAFVAATPR